MLHDHSEVNDWILAALSVRQSVSWQSFRDLVDSVYSTLAPANSKFIAQENAPLLRYQLLRDLYSLGHVDYAFQRNSGKVWVTPPRFIVLPWVGDTQVLLVGARSLRTPELLREAVQARSNLCSLASSSKLLTLRPARIAVTAYAKEALPVFCKDLGIELVMNSVPWRLVCMAGSLEEYIRSLPWQHSESDASLGEIFDPVKLKFETFRRNVRMGNTELRRILDRRRNTYFYLLCKNSSSAEVDLDWGRYTVLQATDNNVLFYDTRRFRLSAPTYAPIPKPFVRALVLCSGQLPAMAIVPSGDEYSSSTRTVFHAIPEQIAYILATKLGQRLLSRTILLPEEEVSE